MKFDLQSIDREQFKVAEHVLNGETVYLVTPNDIKTKWTQKNKFLRSVLLNENGEIVSSGFFKFCNFGENPENFPAPTDLKGCEAVCKIDGSLLIWTVYKGKLIVRTRGTVDARNHTNGAEINDFYKKYIGLFTHNTNDTWGYSILTEWTSPTNIIVLKYENEPTLRLIGKIYHNDGRLETQENLDILAEQFGMARPKRFSFDSIFDMVEMVAKFQDVEGIVLYSSGGQVLHKLKAEKYLALHRLKSELSSLDKVIDLYFVLKEPTLEEFENYIKQTFDFEIFKKAENDIKRVYKAVEVAYKLIFELHFFVNQNKELPQKEFAILAIKAYKEKASILFDFRKGTGVLEKHKRLLIEKYLNL